MLKLPVYRCWLMQDTKKPRLVWAEAMMRICSDGEAYSPICWKFIPLP